MLGNVGGFNHAPVGEGLGAGVLGGVCAEGFLLDVEVARDEACAGKVAVFGSCFLQLLSGLVNELGGGGGGAKHLTGLFNNLLPRYLVHTHTLGCGHDGCNVGELLVDFGAHVAVGCEDDVRGELGEFLVGGAVGLGVTGDVVQALAHFLELGVEPIGGVVGVLAPADLGDTCGHHAKGEQCVGVLPGIDHGDLGGGLLEDGITVVAGNRDGECARFGARGGG